MHGFAQSGQEQRAEISLQLRGRRRIPSFSSRSSIDSGSFPRLRSVAIAMLSATRFLYFLGLAGLELVEPYPDKVRFRSRPLDAREDFSSFDPDVQDASVVGVSPAAGKTVRIVVDPFHRLHPGIAPPCSSERLIGAHRPYLSQHRFHNASRFGEAAARRRRRCGTPL